jgi:integrase
MASIHKRGRSKYWVAAFTTADGRRLKKSTKETNKAKAQKIADEFEAATRAKRTLMQFRRVLGEISLAYQGHDLSEPTVRGLVDSWLVSKKATTANATQTFYKSSTARFLAWLGPKADKEVSSILRDDLVRYRNERCKVVAPKTVNHELKVLKMIFKAARRDGYLADDPSEFVETVRSRSNAGARKPFTIDQLRAVLAVCNEEWRSIVIFGFHLGQRLGDIATLRWSNLDTETNVCSAPLEVGQVPLLFRRLVGGVGCIG